MPYVDVFGPELGRVLHNAHSLIIKGGNALQEKLYSDLEGAGFEVYSDEEIRDLFGFGRGRPDLLVIDEQPLVFELKTNANHDAGKKEKIGEILSNTEVKLSSHYPSIKAVYVAFYETDKHRIWLDQGKVLEQAFCWTGEEFCDRYGLDYSDYSRENLIDYNKETFFTWLEEEGLS